MAESAASGTTVGTFSSTDPDTSDTNFTYALVTGTGSEDNASFTITGNQLKTASALNFETKPSYSIRVRSTDAGGQSFEKVFTIAVTNVNEAATAVTLSSSTLVNGAASGTTVGTLSSNDPDANDTLTFSLVSGTGSTDNASFTITGNQLKSAFVANQATKNSYSIRVRVTDAGGQSAETALTITVTGTNAGPTDIALSSSTIAENTAANAVVGSFTTTDPTSGDTFTYSLVTGNGSDDNASFNISGNQLRVNAPLNFETKSSYSVRVRSTDAGGQSFEKVFAISVTNVNEAATAVTLSSSTLANGAASGTTVGTLSSNDPDANDTLTFSLVTGTGSTDNASFTITGNELKSAFVANQATKDSYSVRVRVTDAGGQSAETALTITVTGTNAAPTDIALSSSTIAENTAANAVVGSFNTTDPTSGDTFTYSLVTGTGSDDNASFNISGNQLRVIAPLNFETKPSYSVRVRSTDAGGQSFEKVFAISVTNVNEAPTAATLLDTSVDDGSASGTLVSTLSNNDPDANDTFTYSLVAGTGDTDNGSFTISGNELRTSFVANRATKDSYNVRIRVTDAAGLNSESTFVITVAAVNAAPTDIALSSSTVAENLPPATVVGNLTTTDANSADTFTYQLVSGTGDTDNGSFTIVGNQLRTSVGFNFETKPSYSIRVRSTDNGGLSTEKSFTIAVSNVNEAPTAIALSDASIDEGNLVGDVVGTLSATDVDAGDTMTFALASGTGDTDNGSFTVVGNQLRANAVFNFENKSSYTVRVRATDASGATFEQPLVITVANVNEVANQLTLSSNAVNNGAASGTTVGTFTNNDPDTNDTFTYSFVSGTGDSDNGSFIITGNELKTQFVANQATKSSYSIRVRVADAANQIFDQTFTVNVTTQNLAPTDIALSQSSIDENTAAGTTVGTLSTTDANSGDTFTYTLATGTGDTDNAAFQIQGNQLRVVNGFNFETKPSYTVRVRSTDAGGLSTEKAFAISVNNVNEAPTAMALSNSTIAENSAIGAVVGQLSTTDVDAGDTHSYSLTAGTGDTDNGSFTIVGNELRLNAALDFETKSSYSVRVRSTDSGNQTVDQTFTITVTNVNEAATSLSLSSLSVNDGAASGTTVGTFTNNDPDTGNTFTYSLVAGTGDTDNGSFTVAGNQIQTTFVANRATKSSYAIRARVSDAGGQAFEQTFTITIDEVAQAPTDISLSSNSFAENVTTGTVVGTLSSTDANPGDTFTYSLATGTGDTDNGSFTIVGNELRTNATFNFETKSSYTVRVRTTDSGNQTFEKAFTLNVTNVNEAPTAIQLSSQSIAEDAASGTTVGTLSATDPDSGDTFTYLLVAGTGDTDNGSFVIDGNALKTNATFNFETKSSYTVRVQATDAAGATFEQALVITITNVNEAPTAIALSSQSVLEDAAIGSTVGTLSATDPDSGDTFTYSFIAGTGDSDNGSFLIDGDVLKTNTTFNFENKSSYTVRIRAVDATGASFDQALTINITNVNEAPTALAISVNEVAESQPAGTIVGAFTTTDPDSGDTFTYQLVAGAGSTDNAEFDIVNGKLVTTDVFDQAIKALYSVRVRTTDSASNTFEQTLTINVSEANAAPTAVVISSSDITNGSPVGTVVGTLSATDTNALDTHTFELVAGTGGDDNSLFVVEGNQLKIAGSIDYNTVTTLSVRVRTTDRYGQTFDQVLTLNVV